MSMLFTRAPLRVSLGGGGTDLPSYSDQHEGFLVSGAIDKYIYMFTHTVFQKRFRMKYSETEEVDDPSEIKHPILREAIVEYWPGDPIEIATVADVPSGTGMGSSGAFSVCLLKALMLGRHMSTTPGELAERAAAIEIEKLGEPVGKQDHYAAAFGGICAYTFLKDGSVRVEPLELEGETLRALQENFLLFYTGETRSASDLLSDQVKKSESGSEEMAENLHRTKEMGLESRRLLEDGDLESYALLMDKHWQNKRSRSPGMTNEAIDNLYTLAQRSGCIGGKVVGAGGGGFLLVYASRPEDTREAMAAAGAPELKFNFEFEGCTGAEYS